MKKVDDEFELRLGRLGRDEGSGLKRVRTAVRMRSAGKRSRQRQGPTIKAPSVGATVGSTAVRHVTVRRVSVHGRIAVRKAGALAPFRADLRYLARAGGARERSEPLLEAGETHEEALAFYNDLTTGLDGEAQIAAWVMDGRHMRLVVGAEDAAALGDLKPLTRELMARLEVKLATRLDWIAVDHWDTAHPHTHILLRLKSAEGGDLSIPRDVITNGLRLDAQDIVTRVLGPRIDTALSLQHEANHRGITALDRRVAAGADATGYIRVSRPDLIARLDVLDIWGLATREGQGWRISKDMLATLRAMELHAEVEGSVSFHRSQGRHLPVLAADPRMHVEGVLVHLGEGDPFGETLLAVIETGRDELRYQRFSREHDIAQLRHVLPGAIVAFQPNTPQVRSSDFAIAAIAQRTGGLYSAARHFEARPDISPDLVARNIRRLEAMQRASLIARPQAGDFIVGEDHLKRARIFEERIAARYPLSPFVLSYLSWGQQIGAIGPTHLDRVLAGEAEALQGEGAGARRQAQALQQRRAFLISQGWMRDDDVLLARSALPLMAERELHGLARELSVELGRPVHFGRNALRGAYARRIDLAQGRVALIIGDESAGLLPWRAGLERHKGLIIESGQSGGTNPRLRAIDLAMG
ncbi:MAG: DUF3363 domain-containing protein [Hyphomonadaceae bacterium]